MASATTRKTKTSEKWYAAGLAFECQRSGNCCSGTPGYVWVTKEEIAAIAKFLGRSDGWLSKEHLRRVAWRYSLTERADGDCVFLDRSGGCPTCKIHKVKPTQCRTWPFWDHNLASEKAWAEAGHKCPGINRGPLHDLVQIETMRLMRAPA